SLVSEKSIWEFVISPRIGRAEKAKSLEAAFKGKTSDLLYSFIGLLIRHDRLDHIEEISKQFSLGHDRIKGRIRAFVRSAKPLEEKDLNEIKSAISGKFKGECIIESSVSPDLLGGLVIKFNDFVIDGSIKDQLRQIKRNLLESKSAVWSTLYEN
ncbi:MAG: ATP synthase F1 subunit delta, partial [Leptospira sp.]|nr:ATP synthase F1 subunit delta [Leptospira sp.]